VIAQGRRPHHVVVFTTKPTELQRPTQPRNHNPDHTLRHYNRTCRNCVLADATATWAQEKFPSRTIRIIVPFATGGGVDTLAARRWWRCAQI
jgi:hypothetical protein